MLRWLSEYEGSHVVGAYRKRYGVDWLCAVMELRLLGVEIAPEYVSRLQRTVQELDKKNHKKRAERQKDAAENEWSERYPPHSAPLIPRNIFFGTAALSI